MYIGAHCSIAGGYDKSVDECLALNSNAIQIFLKSPRSRAYKEVLQEDLLKVQSLLKEYDLFLVGHCSYLLNFSHPRAEKPWATESLIEDVKRISTMGGIGIVLHVGKYLDMDINDCIQRIAENIDFVLNQTEQGLLLLENTAGQGTEIGYKFEELAKVYKLVKNKKRLGFCLDTCHAFAAGYDLSTKNNVDAWEQECEKHLGWKHIHCIHFNNSLKECGSRVDRHANLLSGCIPEQGLKHIIHLAKKHNIPLILETPNGSTMWKNEIEWIKKVAQ